jgi:3-methyladenine DNA glycosylase AlkD
MNAVIRNLRAEVRAADKPANRMNYQRWFKEKLEHPVGLKTPVLRRISNSVFRKEARPLGKDAVLDIGDELLKSGWEYSRFFAFDWSRKMWKEYEKKDFMRFERWLKTYVDNWGRCDHLCAVLGLALVRFPELSARRAKWTRSKNLWLRRASAVALIEPVSKGLLLRDVFKTAEILLKDEEDMVQKGYGWMLKVTGDYFFNDAHRFVMKHKDVMPRTALRYAIEKWPESKRQAAMKRG